MPPLPEATFLEGSLLSLLLPACLLVALTVWYVLFVRRVPETTEGGEPVPPAAQAIDDPTREPLKASDT
jgi:hypothetical protein